MPEEDKDAGFVTVARLVRVHGRKGELAAELDADDAALFDSIPNVHLWDGAGHREAARIQGFWPHKNRLILKFEGIDTIGEAERLAGWEVQIDADRRPEAQSGRVYVSDLIGCQVVERRSGRRVGEVRELVETGAAPLLKVEGEHGEVLVPFAASICVEVDPGQKVIRVDLPEGLEELNRA